MNISGLSPTAGARPAGPPPPGGPHGHGGPGKGMEKVADLLGLTTDELKDALDSGKTMSDLASAFENLQNTGVLTDTYC